MARAIDWVARRTGADLAVLWVLECAASFGSQLARAVTTAGYQVVEAARMSAKADCRVGKSDPLDARRIAAAVLPLKAGPAAPTAQGRRRARRPAGSDDRPQPHDGERTATVNALIALLRVLELGIDARKPLTAAQIIEVSKWRKRTEDIRATLACAEACARPSA